MVGGLYFVTVKKIYQEFTGCTAELLVCYGGFGMIAVSFITLGFDADRQILSTYIVNINYVTWLVMFGVGLLSTLAFLSLNQALKMIDSVVVSFVRASDIVLSYVIQVIVFHLIPNVTAILGSACVLASVIIIPLEDNFIAYVPIAYREIL